MLPGRSAIIRIGRSLGPALVPVGLTVALVGAVGDLMTQDLSRSGSGTQDLLAPSGGGAAWRLLLLAGLVMGGVGAVRWAARLGTDFGALLAASLGLLLAGTVALAGWSALAGPGHGTAPKVATLSAAGSGASSGAAGVAPGTGDGSLAALGEGAEGASQFGEHAHGAPGPVSPQQFQVMQRQLAEARTATTRFRSIAAARAAGYFQVTQFIPGLGLHMVNLKIPTTTFDPSRPQILLYQPNGNGGMTLVGVAYSFAHTSDTPPEGFAGGADVWHFHNDLCFTGDGSVTIAPSADACKARHGLFQQQTDWLLHAWIWKTNPNGVFTEYNPNVF